MQITIIGMGLIGTSLGMALRSVEERNSPLGALTVIGYDTDRRRTAEARGRLAIDREATSLDDAVAGSELVVVAVPVQEVRAVFTQIAPKLAPGAVVTDVASAKAQVAYWANEIFAARVPFVGGHPMAGREKSGPAAADGALFLDAIYCLCPAPSATAQAIDLVERMVHQIDAKVYFIDPLEHDVYVAGVSHLPFLLAAGLAAVTSDSPGWREMTPLAASGYRDMTRLASGDAQMHRDIVITNREPMLRWIDAMRDFLDTTRAQIDAGDAAAVLEMFTRAQVAREEWLVARPNMRPGENDYNAVADVERPNLLLGRFGRGDRKRR